MVMEELYDIVDSIADLTVEDVKRHLSNSESSSGGDAEENIVACDDTVAAVGDNHDNRHRIIKEDSKKENAEKGQIDDHSNPAKGTMCKENLEEIELRREACKDKEQKICDIFEGKSDTLREVEMRVKVVEVEEQAVRAVREASTVVAGMISGSVNGDTATKAVVEAAKAVAALATAVDENLEASVVAKEVEARLQDLQALQSAIREQEIERARRKVPKECQTKRPKFSCTTNTRFFTSLSQKPR